MVEIAAVPARRQAGLRVWQGGLLLGIALLLAHDVAGLDWRGHSTLFDRWLYDGIELLAGFGCLARAVLYKTERGASIAFGLALISTTIGDALYDFAYAGNPPYPSVADLFYLPSTPAATSGWCCSSALASRGSTRASGSTGDGRPDRRRRRLGGAPPGRRRRHDRPTARRR